MDLAGSGEAFMDQEAAGTKKRTLLNRQGFPSNPARFSDQVTFIEDLQRVAHRIRHFRSSDPSED